MTPEALQRRSLLRTWLAAGIALSLPAVVGCDRKESIPETNPMTDSDAVPPPTDSVEITPPTDSAPAAAVDGKLSQTAVQYQDQPKGDQNCANCLHFVAEDNTCNLVQGQVSPQGWCSIWIGKPA